MKRIDAAKLPEEAGAHLSRRCTAAALAEHINYSNNMHDLVHEFAKAHDD